MKHKKQISTLLLAVMLFLAGMAAFLIPLVTEIAQINQDAEEYDELGALCKAGSADAPLADRADGTPVAFNDEQPSILQPVPSASPVYSALWNTGADLAACQAQNADFVAWLQIPNTTVDYPVVWSDDTAYYLNHTFTGKKSYIGTLFSLKRTDYSTPSRNIAIYGHHIRSNDQIMFSPLLAYKDAAFYAEHKIVYLDTLYHTGVYTVFAVSNMHNGDWEPSTADFSSDEAFLAFVNSAKAQTLYDTGVAVQASDHILTLITCDRTYGGKAGRLIVMAVKQ